MEQPGEFFIDRDLYICMGCGDKVAHKRGEYCPDCQHQRKLQNTINAIHLLLKGRRPADYEMLLGAISEAVAPLVRE